MAYARLIRQSASLHLQLELSRNLDNSQYRKIRVIFQSKRLETRKELLIQSDIFDRSNYLSHQRSLISSLAVFFIQILSFALREFMEVLFLNLSFSCLYPGFFVSIEKNWKEKNSSNIVTSWSNEPQKYNLLQCVAILCCEKSEFRLRKENAYMRTPMRSWSQLTRLVFAFFHREITRTDTFKQAKKQLTMACKYLEIRNAAVFDNINWRQRKFKPVPNFVKLTSIDFESC